MGATPVGGQPRAGVARTALPTGARVFLDTPTRRGFVATVIAPIAEELATRARADRIHVVSGWRFGPHFDLRATAHPACPIDWPRVARELAEGASRFPPARGGESKADYLRTATRLGEIEGVPPPYLPLRAHGDTELLSADTPPVGAGRLGPLRAQGLAHLLPPLIQAAGTAGDGALLARVAEAFLALAESHPHGVRFGTFSFRSHAEAFLHWAGPAAEYRRAFEQKLGKDRAVLEELVGRVRDGCPSAPALAWQRAFQSCLADFAGQVSEEDLEQGGGVSGGGVSGGAGSGGGLSGGGAADVSAFHRQVAASGVIERPPAWFAGYRLTINLFYQLLPALDLSAIRRFYLCHAIAECVDAVYDESWQSRLAAVAALETTG